MREVKAAIIIEVSGPEEDIEVLLAYLNHSRAPEAVGDILFEQGILLTASMAEDLKLTARAVWGDECPMCGK